MIFTILGKHYRGNFPVIPPFHRLVKSGKKFCQMGFPSFLLFLQNPIPFYQLKQILYFFPAFRQFLFLYRKYFFCFCKGTAPSVGFLLFFLPAGLDFLLCRNNIPPRFFQAHIIGIAINMFLLYRFFFLLFRSLFIAEVFLHPFKFRFFNKLFQLILSQCGYHLLSQLLRHIFIFQSLFQPLTYNIRLGIPDLPF